MNKQILIAMDAKNTSKCTEELKDNYRAAAAHVAAHVAANSANANAYAAAAVCAAYAANAYAVGCDPEYWLKKYFEETGENREDYEKALGDMRK
tara:strand:- start:738 stop:1019 length:282 start_codon:yes stop_codon:yes gene_type:complete